MNSAEVEKLLKSRGSQSVGSVTWETVSAAHFQPPPVPTESEMGWDPATCILTSPPFSPRPHQGLLPFLFLITAVLIGVRR